MTEGESIMISDTDRALLQDIRRAAIKADQFLGEQEQDAMAGDEVLCLALTRLIEIVGEAAKHLGPEARRGAPSISWKALAKLRDQLLVEYYDVDPQVIYDTVRYELPRVRSAASRLLTRGISA